MGNEELKNKYIDTALKSAYHNNDCYRGSLFILNVIFLLYSIDYMLFLTALFTFISLFFLILSARLHNRMVSPYLKSLEEKFVENPDLKLIKIYEGEFTAWQNTIDLFSIAAGMTCFSAVLTFIINVIL